MEKDLELDRKQRMDFVEYWANYVRTHDNWSVQHTKFINAMMKNGNTLSKEEYLEVKDEQRKTRTNFKG